MPGHKVFTISRKRNPMRFLTDTQKQRIYKKGKRKTSNKMYPSKQGIPSANPRTLASFIMQENSDPIFLGSEVPLSEFASS